MRLSYLLLFCCLAFSATAQNMPKGLLTTPELSNYEKTSTYADVMNFINEVSKNTNKITRISMGTSLEGKDIPVLILANPRVSTPAEAKASGKPVIYVQGNIHSGEVEGKEAVQVLLREILHGDKGYLLDNQIILFAPIYNTDSNDKMEEGRRPSQEDSPKEVGMRPNSQGWDLNRDGMKQEALETKGLIQNIIVPWDPALFVDLHTTNGVWHGYSITWAPSYHTAGEKAPYDYTWDKILPEVTTEVKKNDDLYLGPYGYFYAQREGWPIKSISTYNHHPRYLVNQFGLRNRMAILSESFAHERLYQRINATYAFVREILEFTNKNGEEILSTNANAEAAAIQLVKEQGGKVSKGTRFEMTALEEKIPNYRAYNHLVYEETEGNRPGKRYVRKPEIVELKDVVNNSAFTPTATAILPKGYLIPAEFANIAEHLMNNGVKVVKLDKNVRATGQVYKATKLELAGRPFEMHNMATLEGTFESASKKFGKGDYWVDLAQPLANLIFYMFHSSNILLFHTQIFHLTLY